MQTPVQDFLKTLSDHQLRVGLGITLTLLFSIVGFAATFVFKKTKGFFETMDQKLDVIKDNHLTHIETSTGKTVELLEKLVEGQNDANLKAAELGAFIKAKMD
ncbi:MAG: hypothetical protein ACJ71W_21675 [Terriglobales bacterium]